MRAIAATHGSVHRSSAHRRGAVPVYQLAVMIVIVTTIALAAVSTVKLLHAGQAIVPTAQSRDANAVQISDDTTVAGVQVDRPATTPVGNAASSALMLGFVLLGGGTLFLGLVVGHRRSA